MDIFSSPKLPKQQQAAAAPTDRDPAVLRAAAEANLAESRRKGYGSLITNRGGAAGLDDAAPISSPSLIASNTKLGGRA